MPNSVDDPVDWYREARRHLDNDDAAQALVCIDHHRQLRPGHFSGLLLYAEILSELRRFADAEAILRCVESEATNEGGWVIALTAMRHFRTKGDFETASKWANRVIHLRPAWTVGYIYLGSCLVRLGRLDEAFSAYQRATELPANEHNDLDEAYLNMALIRRAERRFAEALTLVEQAIEIDPEYSVSHEVRNDILAAIQLAQRFERPNFPS